VQYILVVQFTTQADSPLFAWYKEGSGKQVL